MSLVGRGEVAVAELGGWWRSETTTVAEVLTARYGRTLIYGNPIFGCLSGLRARQILDLAQICPDARFFAFFSSRVLLSRDHK